MAFAVKDRIGETSTTTGTGTLTLAGAMTGFQALSTIGANNSCTYFLTDGINWEVGIGTYLATPSRLQRDTILDSSNAGSAVNWGGGTINVYVGLPAAGIKAARRKSKSVAGSSNVTLTQDEMRCDVLELTGVLTGNIDVIVDATVWAWASVYNNTSGSYTVTFKVTGQTGFTLPQGKRLSGIFCDGTDVRQPVAADLPTGYIKGLTWANNVSDATNDIDIAAGRCRDATDTVDMVLASAITKRLDASWAAGTNQGGLDTGVVGNSDYYIWLIRKDSDGTIDALFSLSASSPTMPSGYTYKRLIGWFKRVGGTIVAFKTYEKAGGGVHFLWAVPTLEVDLANTLTTSGRTDAVKVPLAFSVEAQLNVSVFDASNTFFVWVYCPDQTSAAPSASGAPLSSISANIANSHHSNQLDVRTSSTGTIGARADLATVDNYRVSTLGFNWDRAA